MITDNCSNSKDRWSRAMGIIRVVIVGVPWSNNKLYLNYTENCTNILELYTGIDKLMHIQFDNTKYISIYITNKWESQNVQYSTNGFSVTEI